MKKYIDADKLKAEIERQQRRLMVLSNTEQVDMRRDCALQNGVYNSVLSSITSLQQEQPKFKVGDTIHKIGENTVFPMTIERISDGDYVCDGGKCFVSIKFQDDYELVEQERPECIYGRTLEEREKCCKFCSAICEARIEQEQPEVEENGKFVFPKFLYARTKDNKTIDMSYAPQDMTAIEYVRSDSIEDEERATKRSIKEELLRLQREEEIKFVTEPSQYRAGVLDCINNILASLPFVVINQEETDLDEEISHYIDESLAVKFPTTDIELIKKDIAYTARYFWNKGFNAKKNP